MKVYYSGKANLLYQNFPNVHESIVFLLNKLDIDYYIPEGEKHCAEGAFNIGFKDLGRKVAEEFITKLKESGADVAISPYAAGPGLWADYIPDTFGVKLPVPFIHITEFLNEEIKKRNIEFKPYKTKYFLHHGCTVGRKMGKAEHARELLGRIPELEVVEEDHPSIGVEEFRPEDFSTCPGAWLNLTQPELAPYVTENFVRAVVLPKLPEFVGSTCANGHAGIMMGLIAGGYKKPELKYITEILQESWR